jgi:replicative DNA helicase
MSEDDTTAPAYEFDEDFQTKIAALTLRDIIFAQRTDGLVRPEFFTDTSEAVLVDIATGHYRKYRAVPDIATLGVLLKEALVSKRLRSDMVDDVKDAVKRIFRTDVSDRDFVIDKVAEFARHRAVEEAILASVRHLEKGDFPKIEKTIRSALDVGSGSDDGYDFFGMIDGRTETRVEEAAGARRKTGISTGYDIIDEHLYHNGWGRKELSVLMGAAKAGKTLALADFAKNAALMGRRVLYSSLEVSCEIIAARIDGSISDIATRKLHEHPHEVARKVKEAQDRSGGVLKLHEYPTGTMKPSMLRRVIEKYAARGLAFDLVVVDYGDICAPEFRTDSAIENSKSIYVDLRGIAQEYNCALLTATQTNREGAKKTTAGMTDVAEDFNKIRIADIVLSINATDEEKREGEARLFWAASRNTEDGFTLRIRQDREHGKFISKIIGRE